jgi:plastocyanin
VQLAGPPPHFEPADLTAAAGDVVFYLENTSLGIHDLAIGTAVHSALVVSAPVAMGEAATFTVHGLQAGQYIIYCTVDDHAAEGMVGTLTIR